jgi:hypothetical protein
VPSDLKSLVFASLLATVVASLSATLGGSSGRPSLAVRFYLSLMRAAPWDSVRRASEDRSQFPRREAFLAIWFLVFFAAFLFGVSVLFR